MLVSSVFPKTNGYIRLEELGQGIVTTVRSPTLLNVLVTNMHSTVWERQSFDTSPAISKSLDAALQASNLRKEDIDLFDFYSYVHPNLLTTEQTY